LQCVSKGEGTFGNHCTTPPETIDNDPEIFSDVNSNILSNPSDGNRFIIRSVSCGRVITLLEGNVVLAHPDDRGSVYWACVKTRGWYGFRNCATRKFLGYKEDGSLCCSAEQQQNMENFHISSRPDGGSFLLMSHVGNHIADFCYGRELWYVGVKIGQGIEILAKIGTDDSLGIGWEFIEVR
jgi:hypothetical protein